MQFMLDMATGVPVYRQIMDQIAHGLAAGALKSGDQLPTVRQMAVDLAVNPNTVVRAYRELEIRGVVDTQHGTGTFIAQQRKTKRSDSERQRHLNQIVRDFVARAGSAGFTLADLQQALEEVQEDSHLKK